MNEQGRGGCCNFCIGYKLPGQDIMNLLEMCNGQLNWKKITRVLWEQDESNSKAARRQ